MHWRIYIFFLLHSRESVYKNNSEDGGETTGPDMSAADLRIKISSLDFAGILKVVLKRYESSSMYFSTWKNLLVVSPLLKDPVTHLNPHWQCPNAQCTCTLFFCTVDFVVHFYRCCSEKSQPRLPGLDLTLDLRTLRQGIALTILLCFSLSPFTCLFFIFKEKEIQALDNENCECENTLHKKLIIFVAFYLMFRNFKIGKPIQNCK